MRTEGFSLISSDVSHNEHETHSFTTLPSDDYHMSSLPRGYANESEQYPPSTLEAPHRYAGARTPSPTPSEAEALSTNILSVKRYMNRAFWLDRRNLTWILSLTLLLALVIVVTILDKQIVHALTPAGNWMKSKKFGWLIPIAVLFILSFPPLFGHEIVAIFCGVIWGLGVGFAILSAGTFLGEVADFYAFRYCCRARGEKMERTQIRYACLARVVRDGGFKIALIIRLSLIPGHFSTAVFSTCGMGIFVFSLAALLSLPKQLITVYIGVVLEQSGTGAKGNSLVSGVVLAITILVTLGAAWYIYRELERVKPIVIYERRKARQVKMNGPVYGVENSSTANLYSNADTGAELPLSVMPQRPAQFSFTGGEPKVVGWETRGLGVDDMHDSRWGAGGRVESVDDEDDSEGTLTSRHPPPAFLPPPPNPFEPSELPVSRGKR